MSRRSNELLEQVLEELLAVLREYRRLHQNRFSLKLTLYRGDFMSTSPTPITAFPVGGSAQLAVQLLDNGVPYVAPAGAAPFTLQPTVSSNDPELTVAPAIADVTAGAVPLAQQYLLTDLAGDPDAEFILTVGATAPDGTTLKATLTIDLTAVATSPFSLGLQLFPAPSAAATPAVAKRKIPNE